MALEDLVNVSITAATNTPSRPGFGTALYVTGEVPSAVFTPGVLVQEYTKPSDLTDDGFSTTSAGYLASLAYFSANPKPSKLKIAKRSTAVTFTYTLTVLDATAGAVYSVNVAGTTYTYTVPSSGSPTTSTVATALASAIDAGSTVAASASSAVVTVTPSTAGRPVRIKSWTANLEYAETSADPGIATDLAAIIAADNDWYGLETDSKSKAAIEAVAAWIEANKDGLYVPQTSDTDCRKTSVTTDVMSELNAAAYALTIPLYNGNSNCAESGMAWMGSRFPFDPGSDTWKFKTLKGITADRLTASQRTQILAAKGNCYTTVAGVNITEEGWSSSGEYADVTRFVHWLKSEIKIRVFFAMVNSQKIPFTDLGIDVIRSIVLGALQDGVTVGGLAAGSISVEVPKAADVSVLDKAARTLRNVKFKGTLAGAIHSLDIDGELSV